MEENGKEDVAGIFHETYNRLYAEFLGRLFDERLAQSASGTD